MAKKRISLGLRFSNSDYTFAVMDSTKASPNIVELSTVVCPKGFHRSQTLKWLVQEIDGIFARHEGISIVTIKRFEGRSKGNTFEERVENEATAYIAAANVGLKAVYKKMGSTLAKDLGLKGKAKLLKTELDTSMIPNFSDYGDKEKDAILSAWSELL
ncbi:hypothetical protein EYC98_17760 [Halieaceae bacterium IMCC14734]|mgnify:FL=1|uniref:Holliday junction resolvase n=1 Tax=Candidatus Litorirhabdus singularis TaxID=2518993 RepID=A0ABT3TN38_9GAMM|nr:hypothetical protein [Candidatus Litorirhabdus singularis]MCX2982712.1 hypothetical protein [Candidatus Litorirhabdus singularis]